MVTTSGMCSTEPLNCTIAALGHERVMFAADYPFESAQEAGEFMDHVPLADRVREDVAFNNAVRQLGLPKAS
jgi:2,3-dihydroxybenzoate decarboxylase